MTSVLFDSAYPAANAANADPSKVSRVNYVRNGTGGGYLLAQWFFSTTLGNQKSARVIGAVNMRIPAAATSIIVRAYDYTGATVFDTTYAPANLVPIPGTTDRYNLFATAAANQSIAGIGVLILLPASSQDYFELGHPWASLALDFDEGAGPDWKLGVVDPSPFERARGGALVSTKLPSRRTLNASFTSRTYDAAMGTPGTAANLSYRQFMQEAGLSSPVVVLARTPLLAASPTTAELHALQTMGLYASYTGQPEIGHLGANVFRSTGIFEEIR